MLELKGGTVAGTQMSVMKKRAQNGCLGYIGDEILRRLYGDSIKPKDP